MTMMSNLPQDLVEEILFRVPITSLRAVRSTCKGWNSLSKDERFAKKHCGKAAKENLAVLICDYRCCLMSVNLHGIHNNETMVDPFIRNIGNLLNQVLIYNVIHSDGLLLFVTRDKPNDYDARLLVWNPYLGQVRWIRQSHKCSIRRHHFSIGYDNNNNNHKILRFSIGYRFSKPYIDCEIYNLKSNSWKDLDVNCVNWRITGYFFQRGVLLKGNTYYVANGCSGNFLLGFDFTKERFGQRLHLPFNINNHNYGTVTLSSVCEEQLTALHQGWKTSEIWVTTKIDPYAVSWTKFLVLKDNMISNIASSGGRFFIDEEEKKLVVVCEKEEQTNKAAAYMIREDGYCKEVDLGESKGDPLMCSYVPSLAKIQQGSVPAGRKRKQRDCVFDK